jgi:hypothetical protein
MAIKNSLHRSVMGPAEELAYLKELVVQLQEENALLKQVVADAGRLAALPPAGAGAAAVCGAPLKMPGRPDSVLDLVVRC